MRREKENMALSNSHFFLPDDWIDTLLGEVCLNPQYGWTTKSKEKGNVHLLRTSDITSGRIDWDSVPFCEKEPSEKEKYLLKNGDIVISRAGSVGYNYLIRDPKESVFASYLIRFQPLINNKYVSFFLNSPAYWKSISEKKLGITTANVNATKLKQIPIPLPPLLEQHKIVEKFEELFTKLDAGVEALKKVKEQVKHYRQSVLKSAFEGKLTADWRQLMSNDELRVLNEKEERFKIKIDNVDLPELPKSWIWTQLGNITKPSKEKVDPNKVGLTNYVGLEHIEKDTSKLLGYGSSHEVRSSKTKFYKGDVLYGKLRPYLNKVVVADFDGLCSTDILVFPKSKNFINKFLAYRLFSKDFVRFANLGISGVQHPRTSFNKIFPFKIALPLLQEQKKIVEEIERRFSIADEIENTVDKSLKQAEKLRQSILKKAFEGKLTEKWREEHPALISGENSAEKLLEKIKKEKAKIEVEMKSKSRQKRKRESKLSSKR